MANKRISELTAITGANLADADLLVVVDVSDTTMASSGTNKKITMAELAKDSALTDNLIAKTTLTTDGDVLTRTSGAPARITRADLADDTAFSSRYASVNDMVWLDATNLDSNGGAAIGRFQYQSQMLFDQSSGEIAGWKMYLPSWWSTFHIDMWWTHNVSGGSGNVTWEFGVGRYADGASLSATDSTFNNSGTIAAPAQGVAKVTQLSSTAISRTAGTMMGGYIYRIANDAADTFNGDVGVLGLLFRRVS